MGKKRFCAILLVFAMILSMGPLTIPVMAVNNSPGTQQPLDIQFTTDPGAIVSETTGLDISQSGPWNLTIKSTVSNTSNAYVVLLGYHLYEGNFDADNSITNINASNFDTKDDVLQKIDANYKPYYKTQKTAATIGTEATLFNQSLTSFSVNESSTAFHQKYVALIFDQAHDTENKSDYTIVTFYINKDGYLQTNSYLLRYQSNPRPAGGTGSGVGSLPGAVITEWGTDAALTTSKPSRNGYNFLGWDSDGTKVSTDPNTAAAATVDSLSVEFPAGGTDQKVSWTKAAAKFGTTTFNGASDKIYDVYAIWQPKRVRFKTEAVAIKKDTATVTVPSLGTRTDVPVMELPAPRVGQAYGYTLDLGGTTDPNTGKSVKSIDSASVTLSDGSGVNTSGLSTYFDSLQTTAPTKMQTRLSGTPKKDNDGALYFLLVVTDDVNKTDDWAVVKFPKINKGAQPVPSIDDNTGLETRLEQKDGQIFGFYSKGPTLATYDAAIQASSKNGYFTQDNANPPIAGISGSGAMTNYYLRYGMVFEYRPKVINGETVSYEVQTPVEPDAQDEGESGNPGGGGSGSDDDNPEESKKTYADMPNGGWREVPFPSSWYTGANKTAMEASLGSDTAAATKVIYSTGTPTLSGSNVTGGSATVQDKTPTGFDGWLESYGYIAFSENGLPVIHGLKENDEYEVRFRASTTRDESAAQTLKIGGAVGSSDTPPAQSGGLAINLAGGKVVDDPTTTDVNEKDIYEKFVASGKTMQDGETLDIPNVTPVRENYSFGGWTLGEYDEDGELILYKYAAPATGTDPPEGTETNPSEVTLSDSPQALAAVWEATPDGFASIVFYDWDETTVLGSVVVAKGQDATSKVQAFAKSLQSPESKDVNAEKDSYYVEDLDENKKPKYPLTSKRGYSFENVWLPFDSETLTHYGSEVQGKMVEKPTAEAMDFSNVTGDLIVKACYGANDELYTVNDLAGRYTTEVLSTVRDANDNFLIEMRVTRKNSDSVGVQRLGKPAVRVTYTTAAGNIVTLVNIGKSDVETFSIATSLQMTKYSVNVIDTYQSPLWTLAGIKSTDNGDISGKVSNNLISGGNWVDNGYTASGFIYEGTMTYLNQLLANGQSSQISQTLLDNISLNYAMLPQPIPILKVITAAGYMNTAYRELNKDVEDGENPKTLTYKQMQYAIVNSGALLTTDIN